MNNKDQYKKNKGFALLLALIISSIALSIGLSMLHITLKQLSLGSTTKGSEVAFQAANAGMECLRYIRNAQSEEITGGNPNVPMDCLGTETNLSFTDIPTTDPDTSHYRYRNDEIEWAIPGGDSLCVDIEMHILDARDDGVSYDFGFGGTKTCSAGEVCTFGFVRGYNRDCSDIGSSIFTVQRELTVEF